jgi:hypothetical protein
MLMLFELGQSDRLCVNFFELRQSDDDDRICVDILWNVTTFDGDDFQAFVIF